MEKNNKVSCKICKKEVNNISDTFIINKKYERVCILCGEKLIKLENTNTPGKIKAVELKNGDKAIVLNKKTT